MTIKEKLAQQREFINPKKFQKKNNELKAKMLEDRYQKEKADRLTNSTGLPQALERLDNATVTLKKREFFKDPSNHSSYEKYLEKKPQNPVSKKEFEIYEPLKNKNIRNNLMPITLKNGTLLDRTVSTTQQQLKPEIEMRKRYDEYAKKASENQDVTVLDYDKFRQKTKIEDRKKEEIKKAYAPMTSKMIKSLPIYSKNNRDTYKSGNYSQNMFKTSDKLKSVYSFDNKELLSKGITTLLNKKSFTSGEKSMAQQLINEVGKLEKADRQKRLDYENKVLEERYKNGENMYAELPQEYDEKLINLKERANLLKRRISSGEAFRDGVYNSLSFGQYDKFEDEIAKSDTDIMKKYQNELSDYNELKNSPMYTNRSKTIASEHPIAKTAGEFTGEGIKYAVGSKVLEGLPIVQKFGKALQGTKMGQNLFRTTKGIVNAEKYSNILADQMLETFINSPRIIAEGIQNGKSAGDITKEVLKEQAGNLLLSGAFETLGAGWKYLKGKGLSDDEISVALKNINDEKVRIANERAQKRLEKQKNKSPRDYVMEKAGVSDNIQTNNLNVPQQNVINNDIQQQVIDNTESINRRYAYQDYTNNHALDNIDNTKAFINNADSLNDMETLNKVIKDLDDTKAQWADNDNIQQIRNTAEKKYDELVELSAKNSDEMYNDSLNEVKKDYSKDFDTDVDNGSAFENKGINVDLIKSELAPDEDEYLKAFLASQNDKGVSPNFKDIYRNIEIASKGDPKIKAIWDKILLNPLNNATEAYFKGQDIGIKQLNYMNRILGIKEGTNAAKAVSWIIEGKKQVKLKKPKIIYEEVIENGVKKSKPYKQYIEFVPYGVEDLKRDFNYLVTSNNKLMYDNIIEASETVRKMHDDYWELQNISRKKIYPNGKEYYQKKADSLNAKAKEAADYANIYKNNIASTQERIIKNKELLNSKKRKGTQAYAKLEKSIEADEKRISKLQKSVDKYTTSYQRYNSQCVELQKQLENGELMRNKRLNYRKDYIPHMWETGNNFAGLKNIVETDINIDPKLVGVSGATAPKSKFTGHFQKRKGAKGYDDDIMHILPKYFEAAEYAINIDPIIARARAVNEYIRQNTNGNFNNTIQFIHKWANDLAGKTKDGDRQIRDNIFSESFRKFENVLTFVANRTKAGSVMGNISSSVTQIANAPNVAAVIGNPIDMTKGFKRYWGLLLDDKTQKEIIEKSVFLKQRFYDKNRRHLEGKFKPKNIAISMLEVGDEIVAKVGWFGAYEQAIRKGIEDPIRYADDLIRKAVGGRGIGEIPLILQNKWTKMLAPFQTEVLNTSHLLSEKNKEVLKSLIHPKETIKNPKALGKALNSLMYIYGVGYVTNEIIEKFTGNRPVVDPINATFEVVQNLKELWGKEYKNKGDKIEDFISAIISPYINESLKATPFANYIYSFVPEETRNKWLGSNDPTRYGVGPIGLTKIFKAGTPSGALDLATSTLLPWGGNQVRKTIQGVGDYLQGASYTENSNLNILFDMLEGQTFKEAANKNIRFPIEQTPSNLASAALFGRWATKEGRQYINEGRKPLTDPQTDKFEKLKKAGFNINDIYNGYYKNREFVPNENDDEAKINQKIKNMAESMQGDINRNLISSVIIQSGNSKHDIEKAIEKMKFEIIKPAFLIQTSSEKVKRLKKILSECKKGE